MLPRGTTPLHQVVDPASPSLESDYPSTIAELVATGAHVDAHDEFGDTPLHWAAALSNPAAVKALIGTGADVNARGQADYTPLHCARDPITIALLLEAGADPEAQAALGRPRLDCSGEASAA